MSNAGKPATTALDGAPEFLNDAELDNVSGAAAGRIKVKTYLGGALGDEIAAAEANLTGVLKTTR